MRSILIILLTWVATPLFSQYIPDSEFELTVFPPAKSECRYHNTHEDAKLKYSSLEEIGNLFQNLPESFSLANLDSGVIKLKMFLEHTEDDHFAMITSIGTKGFSLSEQQMTTIIQHTKSHLHFFPAIHNSEAVTSRGYIYLHIRNGTIDKVVIRNLELANE